MNTIKAIKKIINKESSLCDIHLNVAVAETAKSNITNHIAYTIKLIILAIYKVFKGALSGLRPFFANESPLKMMKNAFYFTLKALSVLKIFKLLS